jgi:hypothetical protein
MIWLGIYAVTLAGFLWVWSRALPPIENSSRILRPLIEQAREQRPQNDWPSVVLIDAIHDRSTEA